jgi:hypothetical protein
MDGFATILEEQRKHYHAQMGQSRYQRYTPSLNLALLFNLLQLHTFIPPLQRSYLIRPLETYAQDFAYARTNTIEREITNAVLKFRDNQTSRSAVKTFHSTMKKLQAQAKKECVGEIYLIYETAKELRVTHPNMQGDILNVTDKIGEYFVELFSKISFVVLLVRDAIAWITDMTRLIKNAFCAIRGWIEKWFLEPMRL